MLSSLRYIALVLLPYLIVAQNPPSINGSYKAMGEMVEDLDGTTVQMPFEEHFDNSTKNAAFTVWQFGKKITFVENFKANETLEILDDTLCAVATKSDYINTDSPPSLIGYNASGDIRFSLRQLFDLDTKYLVTGESKKKEVYRNIDVQSWMYEIPGQGDDKNAKITVYAYWSAPEWQSTVEEGQVPLGFEITKLDKVDGKVVSKIQTVSVFGFMNNVVDENAFRAREGLTCIGKSKGLDLPRFPLVRSLSLRSEFILKGYRQAKTMDAYYDIENGLLRVDLDRMDGKSEQQGIGKYPRPYSSTISVKNSGVSYSMKSSKDGLVCIVQLTTDYKFDPQEIINPLAANWSIHSIIGRNVTQYVYLGKTYKRDIPCHLYQGNRTDWPDPKMKITSIWEWCFSIKLTGDDEHVHFQDGEIGLVAASVFISKSSDTYFPEGYTMTHNFYDAINRPAGSMLHSTFDIARCFKPEEKYYLEFRTDAPVTSATLDFYKNATSNNDFLVPWKNALTTASKTNPSNLRIANVQALLLKTRSKFSLYVDFTLLGVHTDLPASAKTNEPTLEKAFTNIQDVINSQKFSIDYSPTKDTKVTVKAIWKTLVRFYRDAKSYKPYEILTTTTTPKTTVETLPPFSIVTQSETTSTDDDKKTDPTVSAGSTASTESTVSGGPTVSAGSTASTESTVSGGPTDGTESTVSGGPTDSSTSTGSEPPPSIDPKNLPTVYVGHRPGTVAGVSISMLLVGIVGGAGGTFYKFKGLPKFLQFR